MSIGETPYAHKVNTAYKNYKFKKQEKIRLLLDPSSRTSYFIRCDKAKNKVGYYPVGKSEVMKIETHNYEQQELFSKLHEQHQNNKNEKDN